MIALSCASVRTSGGWTGVFGGRIPAIGETLIRASSSAHLKNCWTPRYRWAAVEAEAPPSSISTSQFSRCSRRRRVMSVGRPLATRLFWRDSREPV
jgi:hypothetical protein